MPTYPPLPQGRSRTNTRAIWSLVLALLFPFCCVITAIPAIIVGRDARAEIARSGGVESGDGIARAGIIIGVIGLIYSAVAIVIAITTGGFSFSVGAASS